MDMASLMAAQQMLSSANSGLTAGQQQQLLASMSSSLSQLSASQQQQLLASLAGVSAQPQQQQQHSSSSNITGLTPAQQQLLAAAGTSLTSVPSAGAKDQYSRSNSSNTTTNASRPSAANTPTQQQQQLHSSAFVGVTNGALDPASQTKYQQLLSVIEEMSKDIRPCYAGSKSSAERLKRGIVYARILVRECLVEAERSARS